MNMNPLTLVIIVLVVLLIITILRIFFHLFKIALIVVLLVAILLLLFKIVLPFIDIYQAYKGGDYIVILRNASSSLGVRVINNSFYPLTTQDMEEIVEKINNKEKIGELVIFVNKTINKTEISLRELLIAALHGDLKIYK